MRCSNCGCYFSENDMEELEAGINLCDYCSISDEFYLIYCDDLSWIIRASDTLDAIDKWSKDLVKRKLEVNADCFKINKVNYNVVN